MKRKHKTDIRIFHRRQDALRTIIISKYLDLERKKKQKGSSISKNEIEEIDLSVNRNTSIYVEKIFRVY